MVANFSATILVYPFTRQMCSPLSKFLYSTIVQADQKNKETPDFKGFLKKKIERVMGIEPTYPAWKAGVLPLNYTRLSYITRNAVSGCRLRHPAFLKCLGPESNQ